MYCFSHRRGVDRFREVETSFAETHPTTAEATLPAGFTVVLGARNTEKLDAWIHQRLALSSFWIPTSKRFVISGNDGAKGENMVIE